MKRSASWWVVNFRLWRCFTISCILVISAVARWYPGDIGSGKMICMRPCNRAIIRISRTFHPQRGSKCPTVDPLLLNYNHSHCQHCQHCQLGDIGSSKMIGRPCRSILLSRYQCSTVDVLLSPTLSLMDRSRKVEKGSEVACALDKISIFRIFW